MIHFWQVNAPSTQTQGGHVSARTMSREEENRQESARIAHEAIEEGKKQGELLARAERLLFGITLPTRPRLRFVQGGLCG